MRSTVEPRTIGIRSPMASDTRDLVALVRGLAVDRRPSGVGGNIVGGRCDLGLSRPSDSVTQTQRAWSLNGDATRRTTRMFRSRESERTNSSCAVPPGRRLGRGSNWSRQTQTGVMPNGRGLVWNTRRPRSGRPRNAQIAWPNSPSFRSLTAFGPCCGTGTGLCRGFPTLGQLKLWSMLLFWTRPVRDELIERLVGFRKGPWCQLRRTLIVAREKS